MAQAGALILVSIQVQYRIHNVRLESLHFWLSSNGHDRLFTIIPYRLTQDAYENLVKALFRYAHYTLI